MTRSAVFFALAATAEIAGCFAFWAWLRLGRSAWWLGPGTLSLLLFAFLLTRIESPFAGRAFAAYGGVYIAASLVWLWTVEGMRPDRFDLIGAAVCVAGQRSFFTAAGSSADGAKPRLIAFCPAVAREVRCRGA